MDKEHNCAQQNSQAISIADSAPPSARFRNGCIYSVWEWSHSALRAVKQPSARARPLFSALSGAFRNCENGNFFLSCLQVRLPVLTFTGRPHTLVFEFAFMSCRQCRMFLIGQNSAKIMTEYLHVVVILHAGKVMKRIVEGRTTWRVAFFLRQDDKIWKSLLDFVVFPRM